MSSPQARGCAVAAAVLLAGQLTGCIRPSRGPVQAPTSSSPVPVKTTDPGMVAFEDDFTKHDSGWQPIDHPEATFSYHEGGFRLLIKVPGIHGVALAPSSTPQASYEMPLDQAISVDAKRLAGQPDQGLYGVACRATDNRNQYFFSIASNGSFGIDKYREGRDTVVLVNPKGSDRSDAIRTGVGAVNRIRAECVGGQGAEPTRLTLYVNGQKVAEAQDEDDVLNESSGNAGLGADAGDRPPTDVLFDDFVVSKLHPGT